MKPPSQILDEWFPMMTQAERARILSCIESVQQDAQVEIKEYLDQSVAIMNSHKNTLAERDELQHSLDIRSTMHSELLEKYKELENDLDIISQTNRDLSEMVERYKTVIPERDAWEREWKLVKFECDEYKKALHQYAEANMAGYLASKVLAEFMEKK